jgi:hypothetical protein
MEARMTTVRLYNCGTYFNRGHKKELIAKLGRGTSNPFLITDGVGSDNEITGAVRRETGKE